MEVCGQTLSIDDVNIARTFEGDRTIYDASGIPAGNVLVVINHVLSEELRVAVSFSRSHVSAFVCERVRICVCFPHTCVC